MSKATLLLSVTLVVLIAVNLAEAISTKNSSAVPQGRKKLKWSREVTAAPSHYSGTSSTVKSKTADINSKSWSTEGTGSGSAADSPFFSIDSLAPVNPYNQQNPEEYASHGYAVSYNIHGTKPANQLISYGGKGGGGYSATKESYKGSGSGKENLKGYGVPPVDFGSLQSSEPSYGQQEHVYIPLKDSFSPQKELFNPPKDYFYPQLPHGGSNAYTDFGGSGTDLKSQMGEQGQPSYKYKLYTTLKPAGSNADSVHVENDSDGGANKGGLGGLPVLKAILPVLALLPFILVAAGLVIPFPWIYFPPGVLDPHNGVLKLGRSKGRNELEWTLNSEKFLKYLGDAQKLISKASENISETGREGGRSECVERISCELYQIARAYNADKLLDTTLRKIFPLSDEKVDTAKEKEGLSGCQHFACKPFFKSD